MQYGGPRRTDYPCEDLTPDEYVQIFCPRPQLRQLGDGRGATHRGSRPRYGRGASGVPGTGRGLSYAYEEQYVDAETINELRTSHAIWLIGENGKDLQRICNNLDIRLDTLDKGIRIPFELYLNLLRDTKHHLEQAFRLLHSTKCRGLEHLQKVHNRVPEPILSKYFNKMDDVAIILDRCSKLANDGQKMIDSFEDEEQKIRIAYYERNKATPVYTKNLILRTIDRMMQYGDLIAKGKKACDVLTDLIARNMYKYEPQPQAQAQVFDHLNPEPYFALRQSCPGRPFRVLNGEINQSFKPAPRAVYASAPGRFAYAPQQQIYVADDSDDEFIL